jgi:hypothetical protein
MGTRNRSEMVAVRGSPCAPIPLILILNGVLTDFQSTYLNITHQNATCKASLPYLIVCFINGPISSSDYIAFNNKINPLTPSANCMSQLS